MLFRSSIKQTLRAPVRMIACFLVTAMVCAFLCIGLNLRQNSIQNIDGMYASFEGIAVPDFTANVDIAGNLCGDVTAPDYAGYLPCFAKDYDMTPIQTASGVESVDVRGQFGAHIPGDTSLVTDSSEIGAYDVEDVVIFTVDSTNPISIPLTYNSDDARTVPVTVRWSAMGITNFAASLNISSSVLSTVLPVTADKSGLQFRQDPNDWQGTLFTLEPGKTYITTCELMTAGTVVDGVAKDIFVAGIRVQQDAYHQESGMTYSKTNGWDWYYTDAVLESMPIAIYTDDFWETSQGAFYQEAITACQISKSSVNAITTGDLTSVLPFHTGSVYISEGRNFTPQEYSGGTPVCVVSAALAKLNGWKLGDKLSLSFFESPYVFSNETAAQFPRYHTPVNQFFDEGQYEIIGLYDGKVTTSTRSASSVQYKRTDGVNLLDVYLPQMAVRNAPAPLLSQYSVSIRLNMTSPKSLLAEMAAAGLTEKQDNGYQLGLTLYDQGFSSMARGLEQLSKVSKLTLALSCGGAILAAAVLAVAHVWRSRREIACMRSMGVTRRKVLTAALAGLLLVCFLGACVGAGTGYLLSDRVTTNIVASASEDAGDGTFSTVITNGDGEEAYVLQTRGDPLLAVLACLSMTLALTLLSGALVAAESKKSPMLQLGARE